MHFLTFEFLLLITIGGFVIVRIAKQSCQIKEVIVWPIFKISLIPSPPNDEPSIIFEEVCSLNFAFLIYGIRTIYFQNAIGIKKQTAEEKLRQL